MSTATRLLLALALALGACSSDDSKHTIAEDSGSEPEAEEDAGREHPAPEPEPERDSGAPAQQAIPLTVWVDDLVDNHTSDEAQPDTVDDKVIEDDTDESSFDKYLAP